MKKLLVLMVVLSVTGMASAALTDFTLETDGTTLSIIGEAGASIQGYNIEDGEGALSIDVPQDSGYPIIVADGSGGNMAGDLAAVDVMSIGSPIGNVLTFSAGTSGQTGDVVEEGLWYQLSVTVDGTYSAGDVVSTVAVKDSGLNSLGTMDITYVPEPMTVALLGLGGLFLRRRK